MLGLDWLIWGYMPLHCPLSWISLGQNDISIPKHNYRVNVPITLRTLKTMTIVLSPPNQPSSSYTYLVKAEEGDICFPFAVNVTNMLFFIQIRPVFNRVRLS